MDVLDVPVNFMNFIMSLSSSALVYLGEIPEPTTGRIDKNLSLAKHAIDTLDMLKEKTKGNLTEEEESLLLQILTDLKLKYAEKINKKE